MQTFVPLPSFRASAQCLDVRRLGKQRLECVWLLATVEGRHRGTGWKNHPAAKMWLGHAGALGAYMNAVLEEWHLRGYRNSIGSVAAPELPVMPCWWGRPSLHASHRSNLLRKDPVHYGRLGWTEPHDLPYEWPGDPR